jgi:putative ABC transport system permease protein
MRSFNQIMQLTRVSLLSIPLRLGMSSVVVLSTAALVIVFLSLLAMAAGLEGTIAHTGRPDRAIVLSTGVPGEMLSSISRTEVGALVSKPGITRDKTGRAIFSAETVNTVALPTRGGSIANAVFRGVSANVWALRPEIHLLQGRLFRSGVREVIIGDAAQRQFRNISVGSSLLLADGDWNIVGIFSSRGDAHESEVWGDADTVLSASDNQQFQSVTVRLDSLKTLASFRNAVASDPQLSGLGVVRETDWYRSTSQSAGSLLYAISYGVGGLMAVGALFAGLNGMYLAVRTRYREIATVRAVGFEPSAVVVATITEAALLASVGALIGAAVVWLLVDGRSGSTGGGITPATLSFVFRVSREHLISAEVLAISVGIAAGLFPALRAARAPIVDGLRNI